MWVVMQMCRFELEYAGPIVLPVPIEVKTSMIGYLPVYATLDEAKADHPSGPFTEIRPGADGKP